MSVEPARRGVYVPFLTALVALCAEGIVLATSFMVDYPDPVLTAAWLIALAGLLIVMVSVWRTSRSSGASWLSTLGRTLKAAGRFILDFF
ncbi:hypothetical protein [Nostocoides sp. HKS02]|uniref:hypothetical protein n=1 Tax=Nostocoides sp. HKS02 TaxID=1813880 RepID=UPI0012B44A29|nr:hypothetical protein [Tetrasphaera sp. HKS02]QGN59199.1 hypothetical protein GKE56_16375 [Tetrasphaera sp. HKS02]